MIPLRALRLCGELLQILHMYTGIVDYVTLKCVSFQEKILSCPVKNVCYS